MVDRRYPDALRRDVCPPDLARTGDSRENFSVPPHVPYSNSDGAECGSGEPEAAMSDGQVTVQQSPSFDILTSHSPTSMKEPQSHSVLILIPVLRRLPDLMPESSSAALWRKAALIQP